MMRLLITVITFIAYTSITAAYAQDVSYERKPSNPLFKACGFEKTTPEQQERCVATYVSATAHECFTSTTNPKEQMQCKGKGYAICSLVSEYAENTRSINDCLIEELKVWQTMLETEYASLLNSIKIKQSEREAKGRFVQGNAQALESAQTDWNSYKESNCNYVRTSVDGTASGSFTLNCMIKMTLERIVFLSQENHYFRY